MHLLGGLVTLKGLLHYGCQPLSLSLSLSLNIYIYIWVYMHTIVVLGPVCSDFSTASRIATRGPAGLRITHLGSRPTTGG